MFFHLLRHKKMYIDKYKKKVYSWNILPFQYTPLSKELYPYAIKQYHRILSMSRATANGGKARRRSGRMETSQNGKWKINSCFSFFWYSRRNALQGAPRFFNSKFMKTVPRNCNQWTVAMFVCVLCVVGAGRWRLIATSSSAPLTYHNIAKGVSSFLLSPLRIVPLITSIRALTHFCRGLTGLIN